MKKYYYFWHSNYATIFNYLINKKLLEKWNLDSDKNITTYGRWAEGSLDSISNEILSSINDVQIISFTRRTKEL